MKIVHVCLGTPGSYCMVGVMTSTHKLAAAQHDLGLDTEVWSIGEPVERVADDAGYGLRTFPSFKLRFLSGADIKKRVGSLHRETIVHFHSVFIPENYVLARLLRSKNVPWVVSPRGGYNEQVFARGYVRKRLYFALFDLWLIRHARALHAVGVSEVDDYARLAPDKRIVVIPNGQDLDELELTEPPVDFDQRPAFCFCGRLDVAHKGLDLLVEGFARYRSAGGAGSLWLVGDGEERQRLQKLARDADIADDVHFCGTLYGADKLRHMAGADVFVLTSRWEGMPLSALEAAGLSRPLLLSSATNLGDFVQRYGSGIVLPHTTPEGIAEAMHKLDNLYQHNQLSTLGEKARAMVQDEFDWTRIAREVVDELYA